MQLKAAPTPKTSSGSNSESTLGSALATGFSCTLLDDREGIVIIEVMGPRAAERFKHEPGGHRWQRVPPTERHGRRQTSTITVAVIPAASTAQTHFREADVEWKATRGSGKGGQARNKTSNAVQMTHKPSGFSVRVETERSQAQNRATALQLLAARLAAQAQNAAVSAATEARRAQVGSGQRGDKVRTIRMQDDTVTQHATGRRTSVSRYLKGFLEDLA